MEAIKLMIKKIIRREREKDIGQILNHLVTLPLVRTSSTTQQLKKIFMMGLVN
jgi:hypothetical protein